MFVACECYGGSDTDVCIFDTEDCSVERISIKDLVPYVRELSIRNLIYDNMRHTYKLGFEMILRADFLHKTGCMAFVSETMSDMYILVIQGFGTIKLSILQRGFYVNGQLITRSTMIDVSYFFLYKDYVVLRCLYVDFVRESDNYFTVIVHITGKVDYYEADFSKVTNQSLANKLEMLFDV